jgi:uncharacterized Zn-binding protein involved in type VI secretion
MNVKPVWLAALCVLPSLFAAQNSDVITMDHEPHHHLALHNDYVKVFNVEVAPGDSIILHSHDADTIAIAIGDQLVTVGIPGKTVPPSKNADGQVRLQRAGYIHSTHVDGDTPYHTVAVELMHPQTNFHNVCAEILPGQPLDCPASDAAADRASHRQTLLASADTVASLIRVPAHKSIEVEDAGPELIVALDDATISGLAKEPMKTLKPGDFIWLDDHSNKGRSYTNKAAKEARFILIGFVIN